MKFKKILAEKIYPTYHYFTEVGNYIAKIVSGFAFGVAPCVIPGVGSTTILCSLAALLFSSSKLRMAGFILNGKTRCGIRCINKLPLEKIGRPDNIDGFTQEKRFFIVYATAWRTKYRDDAC